MQDLFPLALAPLAGVTDKAFRCICKQYGADVMTTEMISSKGLYYKDRKTAQLLDFTSYEQPIGIQIFGSDPPVMAYAAKTVEEYGPAFIDINMGCPVPKIVGNGDGSALMKNISLASKVITSVKNSVNVPVSVKFRLGYDKDHINAVEFAKMCEDCGASSITVHGRTREQFYSGKADYGVIRDVCEAVNIFVYGNGDVFSPEDALKIKKETGCNGVMIARGALGNPFIFRQTKEYMAEGVYSEISVKERLQTAILQTELMCKYKPETVAVPEARKHVAWYLKGLKGSAACKTAVFSARTLSEIKDLICKFEQSYDKEVL